jgi:glucan biosynthesis protein C
MSGMQLVEGTFYRDFADLFAPLRTPLFTFLSGFVYAYRPVVAGHAGQFAKKKLHRLGVPFLTVTTIYFLLTFVAGDVSGKIPLEEGWKIYFFSYVHFWFLQAILLIFAVVVVLELIGALATFGAFVAILTVATIASVLIPFFPDGSLLSFDGAIRLMPFFLIGLGANRFRAVLMRPAVASACALAFVATAAIHVSIALQPGVVTPRPLAMAVSLSGVLALIYFTPRVRWIEPIGAYSFAVYLFHPFAVAPTRKILQALGVEQHAVLFVVCLAAGLFGPIVVELLARRMPLSRTLLLGERRSARVQPAEPPNRREASAMLQDDAL